MIKVETKIMAELRVLCNQSAMRDPEACMFKISDNMFYKRGKEFVCQEAISEMDEEEREGFKEGKFFILDEEFAQDRKFMEKNKERIKVAYAPCDTCFMSGQDDSYFIHPGGELICSECIQHIIDDPEEIDRMEKVHCSATVIWESF